MRRALFLLLFCVLTSYAEAAVVFFSGFEGGDLGEYATISGTTGTGTTIVRSGRFVQSTPGTPGGRVETLHSPTLTSIGVRFAFQFDLATFTSSDSFDSIFRIVQGTSNFYVIWQFQAISSTQGTVRLQDADLTVRGSTTLTEGTWYLFEAAVVQSATVGSIVWKVDGVELTNVSGINTGTNPYDRIHSRGAVLTNATGTFYHDDIIIHNTNTLPGDGHCIASQGTIANETPTYDAWTKVGVGVSDIEGAWGTSPFNVVQNAISPGAGDPLAQTTNAFDMSETHAGALLLSVDSILQLLTFSGGTAGSGETNQAVGQGFTPGSEMTVGAIAIRLAVNATPTDSMFVELVSGSIDGTVIATASNVHVDRFQGTTVVTQNDAYFPFPVPVTLTSGTEYFFRLFRTGARDTTNNYTALASTASQITGGSFIRSNNVWASNSTAQDIAFFLFGNGGILTSVDTINACKVGVVATRSAGAGRTHKIRRRINGTDTDTVITPSGSDAYFETAIFTDTFANLNLVEIGGEKSGGAAGRSLTIEDAWLMVDYTAPAVAVTPSRRIFRMLSIPPFLRWILTPSAAIADVLGE